MLNIELQQEAIVFNFMIDVANNNELVAFDCSEFFEMEVSFLEIKRELKAALGELKSGKGNRFAFRRLWMGYRFAAKAYYTAFAQTLEHYEYELNS